MSQTVFPESFVVEPTGRHLHTIILLHGRGSSGNEFAEELFESTDSASRTLRDLLPGYRWVFPSARTIFSRTFQEVMSQWYDIASLTDPDQDYELQLDGMRDSVSYIHDLVGREQTLAPTGKVILGGISQGLSVAVIVMLLNSSNLRALIGFSSWLPLSNKIQAVAEKSTPIDPASIRDQISDFLAGTLGLVGKRFEEQGVLSIFLAHCMDDNVVAVHLGQQMMAVLTRLGHEITMIESADGGHWINEPQAIEELIAFLVKDGLYRPLTSST